MNIADNNMKALSVDSMLNFETVKYYGAEEFEAKAYIDAIKVYQVCLIFNFSSLNKLTLKQCTYYIQINSNTIYVKL